MLKACVALTVSISVSIRVSLQAGTFIAVRGGRWKSANVHEVKPCVDFHLCKRAHFWGDMMSEVV